MFEHEPDDANQNVSIAEVRSVERNPNPTSGIKEGPKDMSMYEKHWMFSADTVPYPGQVVLTPDTSGAYGMFWHKEPITSGKWDVRGEKEEK